MFNSACERGKLSILMVHIPGTANTIADALSRGHTQKATEESLRIFGNAKHVQPTERMLA